MKKVLIQMMVVFCALLFSSLVYANGENRISLLYVLHSNNGQLQELADHTFELQVHPLKGKVLYFSDRPDRLTGTLSVEKFVKLWTQKGQNSFGVDNPNAAVVAIDDNGKDYSQDLVVLEQPTYDSASNTLRFPITKFNPQEKMATFKNSAVSVFIDANSAQNWAHFRPAA